MAQLIIPVMPPACASCHGHCDSLQYRDGRTTYRPGSKAKQLDSLTELEQLHSAPACQGKCSLHAWFSSSRNSMRLTLRSELVLPLFSSLAFLHSFFFFSFSLPFFTPNKKEEKNEYATFLWSSGGNEAQWENYLGGGYVEECLALSF